MRVSRDYYDEYNALPKKVRRQVMRTLRHWGGWTKTSVYRKLSCPNLSPIEQVLISGVMGKAMHPTGEAKQLEIAFDWDQKSGSILCL